MSAGMCLRPDRAETALQVLQWLRSRADERAHLRLDSRDVTDGDVFFACRGGAQNGRQFIDSAIGRGAIAVVVEAIGDQPAPETAVIPMLVVGGLRALLGDIADQWYGQPSQTLSMVAVTGTNGKTSTVQWIARALGRHGKACGTIGTFGAILPDGRALADTLTTPDVLTLHRLLAQMRDAGADCIAIEASSIGIAQGRLDGVRLDLAAFTNLTRDHLDYHGTMAAYEAAKARLFAWPGLTARIINIDDAAGVRLYQAWGPEQALSSGFDPAAAVRARDLAATAHGQIFTLVLPEGEAQIATGLLGRHNVSNLLTVATVLHVLGWPLAAIAPELSKAEPVAGRLETVTPISASAQAATTLRNPLVVVDYAHTPDALQRALEALRPVAQARGGRLIALFGCGGNRDAGKRPEMGRIAADTADTIILTSDNPRDEPPRAIIDQIAAGMPCDAAMSIEPDRALAIMQAVWSASSKDIVLLAGKGHETYQEAAGVRSPFDDRQWASLALLLPAVSVNTDTRALVPGELFVALAGESFDGHHYLAQAQAAGACAAVVAYPVAGSDLPQIVVGATGAALIRIGTAWRRRYSIPTIAVAGSNGKTTTKEMIAAILADWLGQDGRLATAGNFNNAIGVPLTLLRLNANHRAAVIEVGMNHPGEIAVLAAMVSPTVALVTNAQREHQEFMQSVQAVAVENGAVLSFLAADGVAIYPEDDAHTPVWDGLTGHCRRSRFGLSRNTGVYAEQIHAADAGTYCKLHTPVGSVMLRLAVPGLHNLRNALAATAAALAVGAPLNSVVRALENFDAVKGRMQRKTLPDGVVLIDDTYNANPDSVRAAIDVLAQLPARRVLVLGDMGEVGENGPAMHHEVGAYAREKEIDFLYTLGSGSGPAAQAFGKDARACASVQEVVQAVRARNAGSILVKGSRFMRMERVVMALMEQNAKVALGGPHAT